VKRLAHSFAVFLALVAALVGCPGYHRGAIPGEPKTATFAEIDGVRVRYLDVGEGPPVVLVHGFASSLDAWGAIVPELSKRHRVLALDMMGFGFSERPDTSYSPRAQAELVMKLAEKRGIERPTLVGHSFGASVVLALALAHPDRVARIALYDAFVYEDQIPTFFHWSRGDGVGEALFTLYYRERADERMRLAFYDPSFVTEALVESVEDQLDRPGTVAAALATVRAMRYAGVEHEYRKVQAPTLLLWGREDTVTPLAYGERLAAELPQAKLVVYPRCGHFPMLEARARSTADLIAFVDEAPRAEPKPEPKTDGKP
jgi:pimeloyl-ACP methyl ester carboxylesterase